MDYSGTFLKLFSQTAELLLKSNIPFCVAGGMAVSIVSTPRATEDLDFLVGINESDLPRLRDIVKDGLPVLQVKEHTFDITNTIVWRTILDAPQEPDGVLIVDFLFGPSKLFESALKRAKAISLGGLNIPVATPEDLILMKQQAGRPQDLVDIQSIRDATPNLDEDYLKRWESSVPPQ